MNKYEKALENIRKVMRTQDEEFRREAGLEPRQPKPEPKIPSFEPEPELQDSQKDSGGNLDPNRFLLETAGEPATQTHDTAPEIVEVIPQKDSRHSWLYNEVAKAVQNASGGNPNTKVVAVFVPVVQSGHELENLPVHETVELPPVNEEDFRIEDEIDIQNDPVPAVSEPQEPEEPVAADMESCELEEVPAAESAPSELEEPAATEADTQEAPEPDLPEELSVEPEQAEHLGELIPESIEHPDPELAEAYNTIEEKLDESFSAEQEQHEPEETTETAENAAEISENISEISAVDMSEPDITENDDYSEAEKMSFTEIPVEEYEVLPDTDIVVEDSGDLPDLVFPDELEDEEVIDDIDESSEDRKAN